MASIDGILETVLPDGWYKEASYKVRGAILRGVKTGLATTTGILLAAATAGTLLPAATAPYIVAVVTLTLAAVDKFIREWKVEDDPVPPPPTTTDQTPSTGDGTLPNP